MAENLSAFNKADHIAEFPLTLEIMGGKVCIKKKEKEKNPQTVPVCVPLSLIFTLSSSPVNIFWFHTVAWQTVVGISHKRI